MSLRTKLILTHTIIALVAIGLIGTLTNRVLSQRFAQLAQNQARNLATVLVEPLAECYARRQAWPVELRRCFMDDLEARRLLPFRQPGSQRVLIANPQQRLIFDSKQVLKPGQLLSADQLNRGVPIRSGQSVIGTVIVVPNTGVFGREEDQFLLVVRRSVLIASVAAGILALASGIILAQGLTRPLRALTQAAHQLASGDLHAQVVPTNARNEVDELGRAFNAMSGQLRQMEDLRRQMVADIAHELRTPLSVLKLELESIEDGITSVTPAVIGSLTEEVSLLNRLIDDLRLLSIAETGQLPLHPEAVAVNQLVERMLGRMQGPAHEQNITLHSQVRPDLPAVQADPIRIQQVLGNLLHNALRYTPPGGAVVLEVTHQGQELIFSISDSGPGFSAEEARVIFERFYRTDKARTRDTGGSGLGLAIVRSLALAMGGRVWATSGSEGGASFHVALPSAA